MPDGTTVWTDLVAAHATENEPRDGNYPEHRPVAAVLACSDARVPPSILFGRSPGEFFEVRIAGNSATADAVASLTYAVDHLDVPLLMVLGHTGCGAVGAALSDDVPDDLRAVVEPINEVFTELGVAPDDPDEVVVANVRLNMRRLSNDPGPIGKAIADGAVELRGAVHDLRTNRLVDVTDVDLPFSPIPTRK